MSTSARNSLPLVQVLPTEEEVVLHVSQISVIPRTWPAPTSRFVFQHPYTKLFYFLRHEGISLTLGKVLASRIQERIAKKRVLAVVSGNASGRSVIAVGPLMCKELKIACFPKAWVSEIPLGRDSTWCQEKVLSYLEDKTHLLAQLFDYSPYSGVCADFCLEDVFVEIDATSHDLLDARAQTVAYPVNDAPLVRGSTRKFYVDSLFQSQKLLEPESERFLSIGKRGAGSYRATDRVAKRGIHDTPQLFVAGAGAYVHAYVLPALKAFTRHTVVDINPLLAVTTARRFGFFHAEASIEIAARRLLEVESPIFVIATYHSTHVRAAEVAFAENPHTKIFVEKPPVTNYQDLDRLLALRKGGAWIEVGYNRRFSPLIRRSRFFIERESGPILMFCLVKELPLSSNHWYYWPNQGTRIVGNLCHWVDLGVYFIGSAAVRVEAESASGSLPGDEVSATIYFADGSKLVLLATDRGNALRGVQEYIDIRRGDTTITINDFLSMEVLVGGKSYRYQPLFRDKGHWRMYDAFRRAVVAGERPLYSDEALKRSSDLYLRIRDAVLVKS